MGFNFNTNSLTPSSGSGGGGSGGTVDQTYDPISTNAQSGTAVAEAVATKQDVIDADNKLSYNYLSDTPTIPTVIPADNSTITENASNELQTVGVINHNTANDATNPLKFWEGTQAEWSTGASQTWYNWKYSTGSYTWTEGRLPQNSYWLDVAYNDTTGRFVAVPSDDDNYVTYSDDGITWTEVQDALPSSSEWKIAYGNNLYVAVAYNGTIAYSSDGISWTNVTLLDTHRWSAITYGDNKFVAISDNTVSYSTDGINWTDVSINSDNWSSITYGNGKFVAVARNSSASLYFIDENNYLYGNLPSSNYWSSVAYGNGRYVAVAGYGGTATTATAYSTNGINWTSETLPNSAKWSAITYGDNKFAAVAGNSDVIAYTTDGITWTTDTLSESNAWIMIAYGDNKFVVIGLYGDLSYSTEEALSVFTLSSNPTTSDAVYSAPDTSSALTITSVGTGTITLSDTNTYSYNASGNQTTTQSIGVAYPNWLCNIEGIGVKIGTTDIANLASYTTFTGTNGISEGTSGLVPAPSATDNDKFLCGNGTWSNVVTFENQNKADGAISPLKVWNGTEQEWNTGGGSATWYNWKTEQINADTMLSGAPTFAFAVAASDSYAVAVCGNGFSVAPVDDRVPLFLQWEEVQFPTDFTGSAIAYGNGKFVCLSNNGKIAYATDPTNTSNWTVVSLPNGTYSGIRYINSRFVVFGSDIATSTDGVTWTAATMPSDVSSISDIAYGNSIYIVGGTDSSSHNVVAASSDLSTWNNAVSFPTTFYRVAFGNGVFVVINGGDPSASYYSTNGTTWTQNNLSNLLLPCMDIVFGNGVFFVKSSAPSSDAATSIDGISWSNNDVDSSIVITSLATNGTTFVGVGGEGECICVVLGKSCYTSEASPTTASTVYSAPNVASALTIQYVDMGMEQIFLSDNNTYTYDATGNLTTNTSVGVAHPDYLCFINGVGVKIGTTVISEVAGS